MFNQFDTSGDGIITLDEYKRGMGLMPPEHHKFDPFPVYKCFYILNKNFNVSMKAFFFSMKFKIF